MRSPRSARGYFPCTTPHWELRVSEDSIAPYRGSFPARIFTSDNGQVWGIRKGDYFRSAGPLRGHKQNLYEGGIRVPAIARWPGRIRAGAVRRPRPSWPGPKRRTASTASPSCPRPWAKKPPAAFSGATSSRTGSCPPQTPGSNTPAARAGQLVSDSHMRHHPVNPMTDSNLVRVLQAQTRRAGSG